MLVTGWGKTGWAGRGRGPKTAETKATGSRGKLKRGGEEESLHTDGNAEYRILRRETLKKVKKCPRGTQKRGGGQSSGVRRVFALREGRRTCRRKSTVIIRDTDEGERLPWQGSEVEIWGKKGSNLSQRQGGPEKGEGDDKLTRQTASGGT